MQRVWGTDSSSVKCMIGLAGQRAKMFLAGAGDKGEISKVMSLQWLEAACQSHEFPLVAKHQHY